jgi:hypothetical protein
LSWTDKLQKLSVQHPGFSLARTSGFRGAVLQGIMYSLNSFSHQFSLYPMAPARAGSGGSEPKIGKAVRLPPFNKFSNLESQTEIHHFP